MSSLVSPVMKTKNLLSSNRKLKIPRRLLISKCSTEEASFLLFTLMCSSQSVFPCDVQIFLLWNWQLFISIVFPMMLIATVHALFPYTPYSVTISPLSICPQPLAPSHQLCNKLWISGLSLVILQTSVSPSLFHVAVLLPTLMSSSPSPQTHIHSLVSLPPFV